MAFSFGETGKDGLDLDTVQNDADFMPSYPAPSSSRSSMHWDFSVPANPHPDSYFPVLEDESSWACEQGWPNLCDDESRLNSVPDYTIFDPTPKNNDVSGYPLANGHGTSSNCYADLAKITEHEKWDNSSPGNGEHQTGPREHYHAASSTTSLQNYSSVPLRGISRALSDPNGSNLLARSQALSSSEGQSHPKRRQSWDGHSISDSGDHFEETTSAITSKSTPKTAHSVIERRYRENINTKITQLDKVLISACDQKSLTSGENAVEATSKTRKADVLTDAIKYVKQTELESKDRRQEVLFLRLRVAALEKRLHCVAIMCRCSGWAISGRLRRSH